MLQYANLRLHFWIVGLCPEHRLREQKLVTNEVWMALSTLRCCAPAPLSPPLFPCYLLSPSLHFAIHRSFLPILFRSLKSMLFGIYLGAYNSLISYACPPINTYIMYTFRFPACSPHPAIACESKTRWSEVEKGVEWGNATTPQEENVRHVKRMSWDFKNE